MSLLCSLYTCLFLPLLASATLYGSITVSPNIINQNGVHRFTVDTTTIIPNGGKLTITFPSPLVLSPSASCSYYFGMNTQPTCTASGNVLTVSGAGVFPNQFGIILSINYVTNPGSAQLISTFLVNFYNAAGVLIDTSAAGAFFFQYLPDTMTSGTITSSSYIVGATANWVFTLKNKNIIPSGGIIKVNFPKWNLNAYGALSPFSILSAGSNTCSAISGLSFSGPLTCTFSVNSIVSGLDTLTITGAFPSLLAASQTFSIQVNSCHNLPSTRPSTLFEFYTQDSLGNSIDSLTGVTLTMLTPAIITQASISVDAPTTVDAQTTYLFQFFAGNPIPVGGEIHILIPSSVGVGSLTAVTNEQRINAAVTVSSVGGSMYYVKLTNGYLSSSDYVPVNGLVAFRLQYLVNPSAPAATVSFHIETWDSNQYIIEQITQGLIVTPTTGIVTLNSLTYSD